MQAPQPLEHEVERGKVGHQQVEVEVDVETLLDDLSGDEHGTGWPLGRRPRAAEPVKRASLAGLALVERKSGFRWYVGMATEVFTPRGRAIRSPANMPLERAGMRPYANVTATSAGRSAAERWRDDVNIQAGW